MGPGTSMLSQLFRKLNFLQNTNLEKNISGRYVLCSQNEKENTADLRSRKSRKGYQGHISLVPEARQPGLSGQCDRPERSRKGGGHNLLEEMQGQA